MPQIRVEDTEHAYDPRPSTDALFQRHDTYRTASSVYSPDQSPQEEVTENPLIPATLRPGPQQSYPEDTDPFADPMPQASNSATIPEHNTETRTVSSGPSIVDTPIAGLATPKLDYFRDSYRISPETAALFEAHSRRMEENAAGEFTTQFKPRRISQRKSSTDLRRQNALR